MNYRFLQKSDFNTIYAAFVSAFSDYSVKMQPSREQLLEMLTRRAMRYDISVGAFEGESMAGFTLNGLDIWNGKLTAYDTGTGVTPRFRGQGIASEMFDYSLPRLKEISVKQYLLEVIDTNSAAVNVCRKAGFVETRKLRSFTFASNSLILPEQSRTVDLKVDMKPDWELFRSFWDWEPSWQNSINAIQRSSDEHILVCALVQNECAGYGVIYSSNGDIPQLAVKRDQRGNGIGRQILKRLVSLIGGDQVKSGRMVNIDISARQTVSFCEAVGMTHLVDQFEMSMDLQ